MSAIKYSVKKGKVTLKWDKIKTLNGVKVIGYILEYNGQEIPLVRNNYTVKNAVIGGNHSIRIRAVTLTGLGDWSDMQLFDVDDEIAPKAGKVKAEQISQDSVKLFLSGFSDNDAVDHYNIYLNKNLLTSTSDLTFLYKNENLGGKLNFTVEAVDKYGNKSKAAKASIKVADKTPPERVSGLQVKGEANEKATVIAWDVPHDNVGVASYLIYVDGKKYTSKKNTLTLKKLSVGQHTISVAAGDKAKNYSEASVITIDVKDTTDPKKGKIKLTQFDANRVQVAISGFSDNSGSIDHYNIYLNGALVGSTSQTVYTYEGKDLSGALNFAVEAVDAAGNESALAAAKIKIAPAPTPEPNVNKGLNKTLAGIDAAVFLEKYNHYDSPSELPSAAKFKAITGTAEKDTIIFEANKYSLVNGKITLAGGDDEIIVRDGTIMDCSKVVDFGEGNNSFTAEKNSHVSVWDEASLKFGSGNDTIKLTDCDDVDFDDGGFYTGNGNDVFTAHNVKDMDGVLNMGGGNDVLKLTGSTYFETEIFDMGDGNDSVHIGKGSLLAIDMMDEDLRYGGITFGAGNDTLVLDGMLKLTNMSDFSHGDFDMLTGLENISGSGQLVIDDIEQLNSALVDDFIEAGITIVQVPNVWAFYDDGRPENSDDTMKTARTVLYDSDYAVWLNGGNWGDGSNCPTDTVDWFRLDIGGSSSINTQHKLFLNDPYVWHNGFVKLDVYDRNGSFVKNISPEDYSRYSDAMIDLKEFGNGTFYLKFSIEGGNCGAMNFGVSTESEWYD